MCYSVAIVGRPNVGKSTLFNRLTGGRGALVDDRPGVTRDRREGAGRLAGLVFRLVDTAGLEEAVRGSLQARMREQTEKAMADADLILMVFDARAGLTEADRFFANAIRKSASKSGGESAGKLGGAVIVVGNKCEGKAGEGGIAEAWGLGLGVPVPLSAAHGEGLGDLHDAMVEAARGQGRLADLTPDEDEDEDGDEDEADESSQEEGQEEGDIWLDKGVERPMRIAVIGRPNMGKSTLMNRVLGEERVLTGAEAGITRDAIEVSLAFEGRELILTDTAGMRRRGRIGEALEKQMVDDALNAIRFAHICVLMIDSRAALNKQDLAIARLVAEEGRGLVIAANMWDAAEDKHARLDALRHRLDQSLGQMRGVALVPISALTGQGVKKLLRAAFDIYARWNMRLPTSRVNRWLEAMLEAHPPPLVQGRRLRIRYATQVKTRPPTFALFVSRPADMPEHYLRYLASGLRSAFGMDGLPIRLLMRKGRNPYVQS